MICTRCGSPIPPAIAACPTCPMPSEFTPRQQAQMRVDINARVMWGDPLDAIREEWLKKGVPAEAVEEALGAASRERREHFRKRGALDLLMALGLLVVGGIGFWITRVEASGQVFRLGGRSSLIVAAAAFGAPLAGILLGIRGIRRLSVGGDPNEAASDTSDTD